MPSIPEIDPYVVLGVQKDATLTEIKSAHRKLVLRCHPDKIKDESLRDKAQDEFQKVQQAYELLSDETRRTKYDQKVRIAELRREMMARGGTAGGSMSYTQRGSTVREYRDGRIYEERTPADVYDEDPFATSRKKDDFGMRQRTRASEEKKKTKSVPVSTPRPTKDTTRSSSKATHTDRAKYRTKERRQQAYDKMYTTYPESEDDASDSSASSIWVRVKRPSTRSRESSSRKPKPTESSRRSERRHEEDCSDEWDKHEKLHSTARDYIRRSKGTIPLERDSRQRSSRSPQRPRGYESADPESSSSRRSGRTKRPSRDTMRPVTSRHGSYEDLESYEHPTRSYENKVPPMPTAATAPGMKVPPSSRPSLQPSRSSTTSHPRSSKREGSSRSDPVLLGMVYSEVPSRTTKARGVDKPDSGYSSPGTPEMAPGESPPKISTRYKVFTDKIVTEPETVLVEPSMPSPPHPSPRHSRTYLPPQQERSRAPPKPVRSSTYAYTPESTKRSSRPESSRQPSSRQLYGEVDYSPRVKEKDIKYAREIGPEQVRYSSRHQYEDYPHPPVGRRQSAFG
ncbi:hypothetical protein BDV29DRAFT_145041 [Aspergillus leporis]|uniref:J domain-containing protein n=1 Tax=Aspergillus leporis TaxID=41062 RepID=A0A5N5XGL2_9EURO|nr:hypothetical protein BDV29DRAFT_145041 [Aspergillus leporis]